MSEGGGVGGAGTNLEGPAAVRADETASINLSVGDGDQTAAAAAAAHPPEKKKNKDLQQVGLSVYIRKKIKQEDKEGKPKTKTYWILEGKTFEDKEHVWEERRAKEGHIQYRSTATGRSTRLLPDVGPTESALGGGDAGGKLAPKRVKQEPRDGWTPEKKALVQAHAKKKLSKPTKDGTITPEAQKTLVKNVADQYMAANPPFPDGISVLPEDVEQAVAQAAVDALDAWLREKNDAGGQVQPTLDYADLNLVDAPPPDEEAVLPEKPAKEPQAPLSPFLPRATFLRDPYYYMRVDFPNPRRGLLEEELESKLFFNPSLGEVKVLGAVHGWTCHPSDPRENEPSIIAVVRDWVGAFCLAYIRPPSTANPDYTITGIHPLCEHLEMGKIFGKQGGSDVLRSIVLIDDQRHVLGFKTAEDHRYIEQCLKLAMCSMYGQGADDDRIIDMRAHSVEFAWSHTPHIPVDAALSKFNFLMQASDEDLSSASVSADTAQQVDSLVNDVRMFMLCTENRDLILQKWIIAVQRNKDPSIALILRQLRIIEEAIRFPAPTNDPFTPEAVLSGLSQLQLELSRKDAQLESIPWNLHPSRLTALWRSMVRAVQDFESREALPDVPAERCCEPAKNTEAAALQRRNLEQRRENYSQDQLPSGVYLSALVYCADEVLCDSHHNLPTELVKDVLTESVRQSLTKDSSDFKWMVELGVDPEWPDIIQTYSQVYDNSGTSRLRALFIEAAKRLQAQLGRQDLGMIFDVPVLQDEVDCLHIITVLRVANKDDIPIHNPTHVGWGWRSVADVEYTMYLKSFEISASARVAFLPSVYSNCRRWIYAAKQYRESMDYELNPGLYLVFFGAVASSAGFRVMVSETHRYLPPLSRVQQEFPTLEDWRWVQCLNEKKRRVGSFDWNTISSTVTSRTTRQSELPTFRHRFLRAVLEIQETVGRELQAIYDVEVIPFDEKGLVKVIAVGERFLDEPPPHKPPPGTTALCFKNFELVESLYFQLQWPHLWENFLRARASADAGQLRVCQPFASDEALRLDQTGAMAHALEVESMLLPLRWLWTLWQWTTNGCQTIVQGFEGAVDRAVVRGIEESVETAVSNHATQQDINYLTLRSIAMDVSRQPDWDTVYVKLREVQRTMKNGYLNRIQQVPPQGDPVPRERTWDELYSDEGSDEDINRPPTIYNMDCTLEELIERDGADAGGGPSLYFSMQNIVNDIVELALIESVDASIIRISGQVISDMIAILECTDALVNDATVLALKEKAVEATLAENQAYKDLWYNTFMDADDMAGDAGSSIGDLSDDDDADMPGSDLLYHQGSPSIISSPEQGVRVCLAKAMNGVHACEEIIKVIASVQEVAELTDCISSYDAAVVKQMEIIRNCITPGGPLPPQLQQGGFTGDSASAGQHELPSSLSRQGATDAPVNPTSSPSTTSAPRESLGTATEPRLSLPRGPGLIMVSSDYKEYPLEDDIDLSRSVTLQGAKGRIRFPAVHSSQLAIVADFMSVDDRYMGTFLQGLNGQLQEAGIAAGDMFGLAVQLKAPLLIARLAAIVYSTGLAAGDAALYTHTQETAQQLWTAVEPSFMAFGIRDWLRWEGEGGLAVAPTLDVCWWGRCGKEAASSEPVPPYTDHAGSWKQVYAETRIKTFLLRGISAVPAEEVALWNGPFGALVEYISLKDSSFSDDEANVLTTCCPNLKSVDLSLTAITDQSVDFFIQRCPTLSDINVDGSKVSPGGKQRLTAFASANAAATVRA